jgi:hypothetical protein
MQHRDGERKRPFRDEAGKGTAAAPDTPHDDVLASIDVGDGPKRQIKLVMLGQAAGAMRRPRRLSMPEQ